MLADLMRTGAGRGRSRVRGKSSARRRRLAAACVGIVGVWTTAHPAAAHGPRSWDFDGDGAPDLVVGRPRYDHTARLFGGVEVYSTTTGSMVGVVAGPDADDFFGVSVDSAGDVDGDGLADLVVGAPLSDLDTGPGRDSGRVMVFSGATKRLLHDVTLADAKFLGRTTAGLGDIDADGRPDFAAAGYLPTPSGGFVEAVFVFSGDDGGLIRRIESRFGDDLFGFAMTGVGDVTGDGVGDFAASAPFAAPIGSGEAEGRVYLFAGRCSQTLSAESTTDAFASIGPRGAESSFGTFLLRGTDQDGDGDDELLVVSKVLRGPDASLFAAESIDAATGARLASAPAGGLGGPGDVDRDLDIDGRDLQGLVVLYGLPVDPADPFNGDFNVDGVIDARDLDDVIDAFGGGHPLEALAASRGQLMAMTREITLRAAPDGGRACGRPSRGLFFPGVVVYCADPPPGWAGGLEAVVGGGCCTPGFLGEHCPEGCDLCCGAGPCCAPDVDPGAPGPPGGEADPDGSGGTGAPPGSPGDDVDGDGVTDRDDCDYYGGGPCCALVPDPGADPYDHESAFVVLQDADDDGDCIPNGADCDSACFAGDPAWDCRCLDDDADGVVNQLDCESECAAPQLLCPDLRVDSDNDGDIDADDDAIEDDEPSASRPGMLVFLNDDYDLGGPEPDMLLAGDPSVSDNELRPMSIQPPPGASGWSLSYPEVWLKVWWTQQRSPTEVMAGPSCGTLVEALVAPGDVYCGSSAVTVWVEAQAVSDAAGDLVITLTAHTEDAACPMGGADSVRVTAAALEVHDLRHWGPVKPATAYEPPSLAVVDLDAEPDADPGPVGGAITDGASICLARVRPRVDGVESLELGVAKAPDDVSGGSEDHLVVGSLWGVDRPGEGWAVSPAVLPLLPTPTPAPAGTSSTADVPDGLAFYVPPEAYMDSTYAGGAMHAGPETPVSFRLSVGPAGPIYERRFLLRRPPVIVVHGLFGHAWQVGGADVSGYWSSFLYSEGQMSPVATRLYFVDYGSSNTAGYDETYWLVAERIADALAEYRDGSDGPGHHAVASLKGVRYAATRADVIGHSMGGQLSRLLVSDLDGDEDNTPDGLLGRSRQVGAGTVATSWPDIEMKRAGPNPVHPRYLRDDNFGAGDIRRLFAIGSPFKGSPLGDAWEAAFEPKSQADVKFWGDGLGTPLLQQLGYYAAFFPQGYQETNPPYYGMDPPSAIFDLSTYSTFTVLLAEAPQYPTDHREVPVRCIVGQATLPPGGGAGVVFDFVDMMLWWAAQIGGAPDPVGFLDPQESDLVVPLLSQMNAVGGVSFNAQQAKTWPKHIHMNAPGVSAQLTPETSSEKMINDPEGVREGLSRSKDDLSAGRLY